jgi:YhcH/YjgK/YiaL family protein
MPILYTRRSFESLCAYAFLVPPSLSAYEDVITAKLEDWTKYPQLKKYAAAFDYLQKTDFRTKEPGRSDLNGSSMYATLSANRAKLPETGKIEAHRRYLDIHYLVEGQEMIGSSALTGLELTDAYKESSDVEFYRRPASYRRIEVRPGQFAIFMPGQGHMPGCGTDTSAVIRKVVVKSLV